MSTNNQASSFKKCDKKRTDFNQCLSDAIHGALKILNKPLPSYGLPSLYDVTLPEVISFGNRTYGLLQKYDHLKLIGLSKPTNINAKYLYPFLVTFFVIYIFCYAEWILVL